MGKISPVSSKYILQASIQINGAVEKPDVIGAIFGQTEGLLGSDLELRELQRSGRIGRIEVLTDVKAGKTTGTIIIPSSLDKAETAIIAASLETIERIGPCTARVHVEKIEDVRVTKRSFVVERAKQLLKSMEDAMTLDSQEITEEVASSVRMMEIGEYGKERIPAGPGIEESEEVIIVEGRADVLNLLKQGMKNAICLNGTSNIPQTMIDLSKRKSVTLFVDGDRGGDLIVKAAMGVLEVDYVAKAPDGKEVEEITKKEIHKALRGRISVEQIRMEEGGQRTGEQRYEKVSEKAAGEKTVERERPQGRYPPSYRSMRVSDQQGSDTRASASPEAKKKSPMTESQKEGYRKMLDDLIGTRAAYLIGKDNNVLGKIPSSELQSTLRDLGNEVETIIIDGEITRSLVSIAERGGISTLVGVSSKVKPLDTILQVVTTEQL